MLRHLKSIIIFIASIWGALLLYNTFFPPISTLMMARVMTGRHVEREYVPLERISPNLVRAVIAGEDGRFCAHRGVDWVAMRQAVAEVVDEDGLRRGGSTITMQTVKNLFLWMRFSYLRKPIEMPLAMVLDGLWSKRRLMERYLNIAEFGRGVFGVEAASRHYFGISANNLTARQAALLAAILPSPIRRNAARPTPFVSRYASSIERRMHQIDASCTRR